jgi:hypothetical protein
MGNHERSDEPASKRWGRDERPAEEWVEAAANARTADDPASRAPHDTAGTPSTRPLDEGDTPQP